jgi:hypothetical protein
MMDFYEGTFDVESFRSHPLYDPWSKASRYMNDKLRFITKYIPLTPGPTGNAILTTQLSSYNIISNFCLIIGPPGPTGNHSA